MKKLILSILFLTIGMSITILVMYQEDIVVHYDAFGKADDFAPVYQVIFLPVFGALMHILFSGINKIHIKKGEPIQLFQYRLPIVVTDQNATRIQKAVSGFIWSIDLFIQLIMLWVVFILMIQKNLCPWMGYVFILLIITSLIRFIYRLYRLQ